MHVKKSQTGSNDAVVTEDAELGERGRGPERRQRGSTRDAMLSFVKLVVSATLLLVCFALIDGTSVVHVIAAVDPSGLALAFTCAVLGSIVLPAVVTKHALEIERINLSLLELVAINFAIRFYVIVLPRVVATGIRWLRYRRGGLGHDALALLAFERVVQLATIFTASLVAVSIESSQLGEWTAAIWLTTFAGAALSIAALAPFLFGPAARLAMMVFDHSERYLPKFFAAKLRALINAVTAFQSLRRRSMLSIFGISAASLALFVISAYIVAQALGMEIGILALLWIRSLVFVVTLVPITIAGIGVREAAFIGFLGIYGISAADALAFSLANFGLQLAIAAVGALLEACGLVQRLLDGRPTLQNKGEMER